MSFYRENNFSVKVKKQAGFASLLIVTVFLELANFTSTDRSMISAIPREG